MNDFYELGIFQRNNWSDNDIVPNQRLFLLINQYGASYPSVDFLPNNVKSAIENNEIPQVHTQKIGSRRGNDEYVVSSWNKKLSRNEIAKMRKAGDYSYINKGLFKKVYDVDGDPYITIDKKGNEYYVYKAVNAWGDSFRANEFYSEAKKSIIDNGLMKVDEVMDAQVVAAFESNVKSKSNKQSSGNVLFTRQKGKYRLMDGNLYDDVDINKQMLLDMGYTDFRAKSIMDTVNKFKENKPEGLPPIGRTNETC